MKRLALAVLSLVACSDRAAEPTSVVRQSFESAEAVLVDVEFDGRLLAASNDPAVVNDLIKTQLLYTVGQLNADRSVGAYSAVSLTAVASGEFEVSYHAKLPVAWGNGDIPSSYEFVLPRAVAPDDQVAFSQKYAKTCADPEGGIETDSDAGRLFLFYRPHQEGCALDPADVVSLSARVTRSDGNSSGKYPEYRRIWSDQTLRAVYVFSVEEEDAASDAGRAAYDRFLTRAESFLGAAAVRGDRDAHIEGRNVQIDARLVGTVLGVDDPTFDAWFDGVTPKADLVMYSGHAGLGANVRALAEKGRFEAGQYVIWATNGCDTLAYGDHTLADRRAALNPDDPTGTKYMDVVSNALGAWFHAGDDTAFAFLRDLVGAPKSYRQIFDGIDPSQVAVVTGEEDNEDPPIAPATVAPLTIPVGAPSTPEPERRSASCSSAPSGQRADALLCVLGFLVVVMGLVRRRGAHEGS